MMSSRHISSQLKGVFRNISRLKSCLQFSSVSQSCATPRIAAHQASLSITNSWSLLQGHAIWKRWISLLR